MLKQLLPLLLLTLSSVQAMEPEILENNKACTIFDIKQGTQEDLNEWVAGNGAEVYQYLNNSPLFGYPDNPKKPDYYTLSPYWKTEKIYGDPLVNFVKVKDSSASRALESLLESAGRFDCRIAQRIVFMECIRRLMGNDTFDECCQQFETEESQDPFDKDIETGKFLAKQLNLAGNADVNPYFRLVCQDSQFLRSHEKIGYFGYIPNIDEYSYLHCYGYLRGDHALLCGDAKINYVGFGSFYKNGGLVWEDVVRRFKKETLVVSLPEQCIIDEDKKTAPKGELYRKACEKRHKTLLMEHTNLISTLQDTFEEKIYERQLKWEKGASFYIDLEKVKKYIIEHS